MSAGREPKLLSVVVPVLNEEDTLVPFYERVCKVLAGTDFEIVVVDDGSTDRTPEILADLASSDPRVHLVSLSRNFGFQAAVAAGLDHARGDVAVTIDADLQDPPEVIPRLVDEWARGSEVVYAVREAREGESWVKLTTSRWFTRLFIRLAGMNIPAGVGDFRLLDRDVIDALRSMPERARFMRGLTVWVGYRQSSVPYRRDPRFAGETSYRWRTLIRMSLDALSSFSHAPLQVATVLGFVVSSIAFLGIPYVIVSRALDVYVEGVSTLLLAVLMLGGIQLITLGIIGEYISRIYDEVKRRPLYVVRERVNAAAPDIVRPEDEAIQSTEVRG
jgi:dolichol-phosphate mannosyltransferase